jgi:hypothetical protein
VPRTIIVIYLIALGKIRVKKKMIQEFIKPFRADSFRYILSGIYCGRNVNEHCEDLQERQESGCQATEGIQAWRQ